MLNRAFRPNRQVRRQIHAATPDWMKPSDGQIALLLVACAPIAYVILLIIANVT